MARPVTQDARRKAIVDAAMAALMEAEAGDGTIADVARRLDVTPNAIRYYYRDADALLWAVSERGEQRFITDRLSAIRESDDPRRQLVTAMSVGLPTGPDDVEWRVTFRPIVASRVTPEFGAMIGGVFRQQAAIYEGVLLAGQAAGLFRLAAPSADIARTLMSMEDYMGFRVVAHDPEFSRPDVLRLMREYASLMTGCVLPEAD